MRSSRARTRPGAARAGSRRVDVAAPLVGLQEPPASAAGLERALVLHHHRPVGEQQHRPGMELGRERHVHPGRDGCGPRRRPCDGALPSGGQPDTAAEQQSPARLGHSDSGIGAAVSVPSWLLVLQAPRVSRPWPTAWRHLVGCLRRHGTTGTRTPPSRPALNGQRCQGTRRATSCGSVTASTSALLGVSPSTQVRGKRGLTWPLTEAPWGRRREYHVDRGWRRRVGEAPAAGLPSSTKGAQLYGLTCREGTCVAVGRSAGFASSLVLQLVLLLGICLCGPK